MSCCLAPYQIVNGKFIAMFAFGRPLSKRALAILNWWQADHQGCILLVLIRNNQAGILVAKELAVLEKYCGAETA